MKKISLFALALTAGFASMAQNQDQDKAHKPMRTEMSTDVRFGIRTGVNLATYEIDDDSQGNPFETENKTSFHGGVFVNIPVSRAFRIQPELDFSAQGSKIRGNVPPIGTMNFEEDLYYINLPVMLQVYPTSGFFVETGPQLGYLIKGELDGEGLNDRDIKDDRKKLDFAWGAGLGYVSRIGLGINARYNLGFSNVYDDDTQPDTEENKYKTRTLQLGLVYHFGAHK